MAVKCWASGLDGCCGQQSEEHYVSETLFKGRDVSVRGLPWCQTVKSLPIRKLSANMLCLTHNNVLSAVDQVGGKSFRTLEEAWRLYALRVRLKPDFRNVVVRRLDGRMLERWFLKTAINLWYPNHGNTGFGQATSSECALPRKLVEVAFGHRCFDAPSGLYWVGSLGQTPMLVSDGAQPATLNHVSAGFTLRGGDTSRFQRVAGIAFSFQGFRFLLWLDMDGPPRGLRGVGLRAESWRDSEAIYHPRRIELNECRFKSQELRFAWRESHQPHV